MSLRSLPTDQYWFSRRIATVVVLGCAVSYFAFGESFGATVDRYWEVSPYRVQILLRFEVSAIWQSRLAPNLPDYLQRRAHVAYGPLWKITFDVADDDLIAGEDGGLLAIGDKSLAATRRDFEKLIVVVISESPVGFQVRAQEYDCLLESWGPVRQNNTRDASGVRELSFTAIQDAFTPMATFRVVREIPNQVELKFRGDKLPHASTEEDLVLEGQVLRPILRRVDREGQPVENGIQQVPWTYFSVNAPQNDGYTGTIVSHTASPLGVRQRGRVDQIAAFVRPGNKDTRLRLHARDDESQPLAGFRVYQRDTDADDQQFIGKTDDGGSIAIKPGKTPIQIVFVQSSGQWIAKIPLVPLADDVVEAPLVDDRKRLEAEAKLVGIREELIDLVARRNILAARTRAKIKANDIQEANSLVRELERMPTATEFEQQRIRQQERLIESNDPRIQQRIEKLFNDTRDVLSEFLPPGLVQELKREIAAAGSTAQQ